MQKDIDEIVQMITDALCTGDLAKLQSHCPDGDIAPITPIAEQVIQDLISDGRDMDADLLHFAQTVKGDPRLEQAFNAAIKTAIPALLQKPHFTRLTYVLQACATDPALWEPAIGHDSFKEFVRTWTAKKDYDSLARLKAICDYLSINPATFGFDAKTGYHLYNIGARTKDDLIITTGDHDDSGQAKIVCHTGGFSGSPRDLIRHWCDADHALQKARKLELDLRLEDRAFKLVEKMLGKNSPMHLALEKHRFGKTENIPDNPLLNGAPNKTIFLPAALAGLKHQDPRLTAAYDQAIDDIDQMIPS